MTGKEAIYKIDLTIKYGSMTQDEIYSFLEYKNIIEKESKVLEILKKYLKVEAGKDEKGFPFLSFKSNENYELLWSMEEYELLKEVLENDRTRI